MEYWCTISLYWWLIVMSLLGDYCVIRYCFGSVIDWCLICSSSPLRVSLRCTPNVCSLSPYPFPDDIRDCWDCQVFCRKVLTLGVQCGRMVLVNQCGINQLKGNAMTYFYEDLNNACSNVSAHPECATRLWDEGYDIGNEQLGDSGMECDICGKCAS